MPFWRSQFDKVAGAMFEYNTGKEVDCSNERHTVPSLARPQFFAATLPGLNQYRGSECWFCRHTRSFQGYNPKRKLASADADLLNRFRESTTRSDDVPDVNRINCMSTLRKSL